MESGGRLYVGAVGKTGFSRRECVFAFAYFVNTFYKDALSVRFPKMMLQ
jgi:hypothetical protein